MARDMIHDYVLNYHILSTICFLTFLKISLFQFPTFLLLYSGFGSYSGLKISSPTVWKPASIITYILTPIPMNYYPMDFHNDRWTLGFLLDHREANTPLTATTSFHKHVEDSDRWSLQSSLNL
jgi:hypothetical protein